MNCQSKKQNLYFAFFFPFFTRSYRNFYIASMLPIFSFMNNSTFIKKMQDKTKNSVLFWIIRKWSGLTLSKILQIWKEAFSECSNELVVPMKYSTHMKYYCDIKCQNQYINLLKNEIRFNIHWNSEFEINNSLSVSQSELQMWE